ncbi:MAG: aminotransferase class I/II-fold pyridoxal phosphate-dependent enzyme [Candidatus Levyibacteriota bacterium]
MSDFYKKLEEETAKGKSPAIIESSYGSYITVSGKKKMNFCSSHYLGFAVEERIKKAAKDAIDKYGIGTGYRTIAGTNVLVMELEQKLAEFKKAEGAIVVAAGYLANMAAIQTILGKDDIVISDELNHASIIDAIRLAQIKNRFIYKHADTADLEDKLKEASELSKAPREDGSSPLILIVTDGVFSMDGDLAPLPEIVALAKQYGALTMVDDAHGEGVLGNGGRGIVDHFGLHGQVDIEVGTLSKAFSVIGGFITGKKALIDFYKQKARQFMFSSALTFPDTAALIEGVKILEESDAHVKKLWENTKYLKDEFKRLGFDIGNSQTPITPVMLGDDDITLKFSQRLLEEGIFASAIRFPLVAKGKARIRVIPSAAHSMEDLKMAVSVFEKVGKELGII